MSFQLVQKSVILSDLERRNGRYIAFQHITASARKTKFTFAISSADELLVIIFRDMRIFFCVRIESAVRFDFESNF